MENKNLAGLGLVSVGYVGFFITTAAYVSRGATLMPVWWIIGIAAYIAGAAILLSGKKGK